jgi:hypothetical protein
VGGQLASGEGTTIVFDCLLAAAVFTPRTIAASLENPLVTAGFLLSISPRTNSSREWNHSTRSMLATQLGTIQMTQRARSLFDNYVSSQLNHPTLAGLSIESHAFNVSAAAGAARIPIAEILEEIGPIQAALVARMTMR